QFIKNNIRVRFIGDRSLFPENLLPKIAQAEEKTVLGSALHIQFLFCYGARQELVDAVKNLIKQVKAGIVSENDISPELLANYLWTAGIPEPDLVIRTGGAKRLSNFLLYQAAYSELYFTDCFWPDITQAHLQTAFDEFEACKRNFGV